jgi:hypothetical protein
MFFNSHFFFVTTPFKALSVIQSCIGTYQGDLLGGLLFALTHFRALHNLTTLFPSCMFLFITDQTHTIGLTLAVS